MIEGIDVTSNLSCLFLLIGYILMFMLCRCGGRGHMQKECQSDPKAGTEQSCYKCQGKGRVIGSCKEESG